MVSNYIATGDKGLGRLLSFVLSGELIRRRRIMEFRDKAGTLSKSDPGVTKGRCRRCNIAYFWKTSPKHRLKNTHCPKCGCRLFPTVHYLKSVPWQELKFTGGDNVSVG